MAHYWSTITYVCWVLGLGLFSYNIFVAPYQEPTLTVLAGCLVAMPVLLGFSAEHPAAPERVGQVLQPKSVRPPVDQASTSVQGPDREWFDTPAYRAARRLYETTGDQDQLARMLASMDGPHTPEHKPLPTSTVAAIESFKAAANATPIDRLRSRMVGNGYTSAEPVCDECDSPLDAHCEAHEESAHLYRKC